MASFPVFTIKGAGEVCARGHGEGRTINRTFVVVRVLHSMRRR